MTGAILDNSLFFNIQIKDINDNAPEFLQKEFNINIKENHKKSEYPWKSGQYQAKPSPLFLSFM